jgi:trehalose 6-phosphate synthase/phosphatase
VEDKRTSLVWHYRRADPEFGEYKARQLQMELSAVTANSPVVVRQGRKIVEVTGSQINKGAAVTALLAERTYDLILLAGDDTTDESMFRLAPPVPPGGAPDHFITIKIGDGETAARHRLPTPGALRRFLLGALPVA